MKKEKANTSNRFVYSQSLFKTLIHILKRFIYVQQLDQFNMHVSNVTLRFLSAYIFVFVYSGIFLNVCQSVM